MDTIFEYLEEKFQLSQLKLNQYSPLVLAYIGDAVYEMIIRTIVVYEGNTQVNNMHKKSKDFVKASAQASLYYSIEELLTEKEIEAFKRGRNAKTATKAKNATLNDYKAATGFEALIGYLYLNKEHKRIIDIVAEGVKRCSSQENL